MLNLNKCTKTKSQPKPTFIFKNCAHVCVYSSVQLSYTTQHRKVLIILPLILQTIIIAQTMSTESDGMMFINQHQNNEGKHRSKWLTTDWEITFHDNVSPLSPRLRNKCEVALDFDGVTRSHFSTSTSRTCLRSARTALQRSYNNSLIIHQSNTRAPG